MSAIARLYAQLAEEQISVTVEAQPEPLAAKVCAVLWVAILIAAAAAF